MHTFNRTSVGICTAYNNGNNWPSAAHDVAAGVAASTSHGRAVFSLQTRLHMERQASLVISHLLGYRVAAWAAGGRAPLVFGDYLEALQHSELV